MVDALDRRAGGKPKFSREEKRKYAKQKHMEGLMEKPKAPLADWLSNPSLLPKKPPTRKVEDE